ncbi:MAG: hypothetical protein F6K03_04660 [Kamptonema sp. SIO4C4]|nr:hypothetical protein [Kamptonema sp. SIO4C4]
MKNGLLIGGVILPGLAAMGISAVALVPDYVQLMASVEEYKRLAASPSTSLEELFIAQSAEQRHRINCFAEGVGILLGGVITAIGIHGLCTKP